MDDLFRLVQIPVNPYRPTILLAPIKWYFAHALPSDIIKNVIATRNKHGHLLCRSDQLENPVVLLQYSCIRADINSG